MSTTRADGGSGALKTGKTVTTVDARGLAAIQAAASAAVKLTELPDFTSEAMVLPEEFEHAMMECESAGAAPIIIIGEGG
ncbi:hypothetical protein [Microbacterium schleiferi]|uniref:hypothetical protein n=1 Tax=Microbacterium schleiferi TaxID=69362 RepID=UPI00311FBF63